jgi:hypothetical protein
MKKNFVLGLAVGLLSILNVDAAQAVSLRLALTTLFVMQQLKKKKS